MINKCPGTDKRNLKAEMIQCPGCGGCAEIFSDEIRVNCPGCARLIVRQRLPSCVDWCKSAAQCLGEKQSPSNLKNGGENVLLSM